MSVAVSEETVHAIDGRDPEDDKDDDDDDDDDDDMAVESGKWQR